MNDLNGVRVRFRSGPNVTLTAKEPLMADATLTIDHIHLVAADPHAAAKWYVDKLGAQIVRSIEMKGAPQIYLSFGNAMVLVRGQRPGERAAGKNGLEWGVDHFGLRVK